MPHLYAMPMQPVLKETLWGGRKLQTRFGHALPEGKHIGESWLVADHPHGTSRVAAGPLRGRSLRDIVGEHAEELYGPGAPAAWRDRFPLIVKIIDAAADLSIQVHPDERYIAAHDVGDSAKTECWVVLEAAPGAKLITGVAPGTDPVAFRRAAEQGGLEEMLVTERAAAGDVLFIPAGRLHAIGAGVVLAEFQQPSDTTYRVYDWGRTDATGCPRELHLDQAVACINFAGDFPDPGGRGVINRNGGATVESLVECDPFVVHRATVSGGAIRRTLDRGFEAVMITEGQGRIVCDLDDAPLPVAKGQAILVPAVAGGYELQSDARMVALLGSAARPAGTTRKAV